MMMMVMMMVLMMDSMWVPKSSIQFLTSNAGMKTEQIFFALFADVVSWAKVA